MKWWIGDSFAKIVWIITSHTVIVLMVPYQLAGRRVLYWLFSIKAHPSQFHILNEEGRKSRGLVNTDNLYAIAKNLGRFFEPKLMLSSNFRCDQIYKYELYDFGHTLLCYLSQTKMFNEPTSEAGLLNKGLMLSSNFRCDQILKSQKWEIWLWSHFVMLLKSDLDVQQTHLWGWFVKQKLASSSSFRCDQIHNCYRYNFGPSLLCYLSQTYLFNKLSSRIRFGVCWTSKSYLSSTQPQVDLLNIQVWLR
jgi:hypothetical protein